jgi:hypothetical protein
MFMRANSMFHHKSRFLLGVLECNGRSTGCVWITRVSTSSIHGGLANWNSTRFMQSLGVLLTDGSIVFVDRVGDITGVANGKSKSDNIGIFVSFCGIIAMKAHSRKSKIQKAMYAQTIKILLLASVPIKKSRHRHYETIHNGFATLLYTRNCRGILPVEIGSRDMVLAVICQIANPAMKSVATGGMFIAMILRLIKDNSFCQFHQLVSMLFVKSAARKVCIEELLRFRRVRNDGKVFRSH